MNRRITVIAVLAAAGLGAVVLHGEGTGAYVVRMRLSDAGGLKNGSSVVVGGVPVGKVSLTAGRRAVDVRLKIDKRYAPVGRDATAAIVAQNILGQKQVRITLGDRRHPAPDGFLLPPAHVSPTTDLDQLLSALDPDTRARLAIMLNETGEAVAGRRLDFSTFLRDVAPALDDGGALLGQLVTDDRALGHLVQASDRFVATMAGDRVNFAGALDRIGQTTETIAARRAALRQTLQRAPRTLAVARSFLAALRQSTAPLGRTARQLTRTAPALQTTLDRLPAFEQTATPALRTAVAVAPDLRRLGRGATPVLRQGVPVVHGVRVLSTDTLPGVASTLNGSMDNILALLENWSRAIQFSDGLGHIFRGEASIAPDALASAIARLKRGATPAAPVGRSRTRPQARRPVPAPLEPQSPPPSAPTHRDGRSPQAVVNDLLGRLLPNGNAPQPKAQALLDYLLGGDK